MFRNQAASAMLLISAATLVSAGCGGGTPVEPSQSSPAPDSSASLVSTAAPGTLAPPAVDRTGSKYPAMANSNSPYAGAQVAYTENDAAGRDHFQLQPFEQWTEEQTATDALGRIGPPAIPALIQALRSQDPIVRRKAAEVLARMGSDAKEAVPDLIRLLDDPDPLIRKTAARTLGRIGPDAAPAIPALMRTLMQPAPQVPR
nr:HEAT repeat domain-containing protein [Pirellula staleyi]